MSPYEVHNLVFSLFSIGITSLLTVLIIIQTKKLTKKQQELDKVLNESQRELQQRQLKLDLYNYRRDVYVNLAKIYEFTKIAKVFLFDGEKDIYSNVPAKAESILRVTGYIVRIDNSDVSSVLAESNCLFSEKISKQINFINHDFAMIWITLNQLSNRKDENKEQEEQNSTEDLIIRSMVNDLQFKIEQILNHKDTVMDDIKAELDVANLEK